MDKPLLMLDFEKPVQALQAQLAALKKSSEESRMDFGDEIAAIERKIEVTKREIYSNLTPYQKVQLARHPMRPYSLDYIQAVFARFEELHGDRRFADDRALIGGPAFLGDRPVMILAHQKGRETRANLERRFGMPHPEGYRKALRLMQMAAKFKMPLVCFIDTPGAYPGIGAEARHVSEAIAANLREMSRLPTPIAAVIIGEGGSGGALGIGMGDRVLIMENAYYSVISPEGCAAILWKNRGHAQRAADALKLTAGELLDRGLVDEIIPEPLGGAHQDPEQAARNLRAVLQRHLDELLARPAEELPASRYAKYRKMGVLKENIS